MGKYLITGAAGFIGSHLAHALVARGGQVRCLDNYATGQRKNLAEIRDRIELCEIDLNDAAAVRAACEGVDVVFHQGALPSVPRSVKEPRPSHETNIGGTFNVLEGARLAGVKRVAYAASSSAYGNQPGFPRVETMQPQPVSPYAVQKLTGELYMQSYWRVYGLETVCLRYFNIFGPRQAADSAYSGVMARFVLQMLRGEQPVIFGDGEQGRDFTYVENVVSANLLAVEMPATLIAGRVFNIACGERHTLNETYSKLANLLEYPHPAEYAGEREGDVRDSLADISAAQTALGYVPSVSFDEGLRRTVDWYREDFMSGEAQ
jgi:nucleoside-diphosphate-sugar epimerase